MINSYLIGNVIRLSATFTDSTGTLVNPTTVTINVLRPDCGNDSPSIVHDSTGQYHADYTPSLQGAYSYVFDGTGIAVAAVQGQFSVYSPIIC